MSFLLTASEFAAARQGVRDGEMTPELYAWLGRLIAITQATRALAPSPVPSGRWDDPDALAEALHAWLEESLLRGGLQQALDRCDSPRALSRYFECSLRNWLVARSRRAVGPRLLERTGELLADPAQGFPLRCSTYAFPRTAGGPSPSGPLRQELFAGEDETVIASAWGLGDFALLRDPSSERSDPVLSTPDLLRFLSGLLHALGLGAERPALQRCAARALPLRLRPAQRRAGRPNGNPPAANRLNQPLRSLRRRDSP